MSVYPSTRARRTAGRPSPRPPAPYQVPLLGATGATGCQAGRRINYPTRPARSGMRERSDRGCWYQARVELESGAVDVWGEESFFDAVTACRLWALRHAGTRWSVTERISRQVLAAWDRQTEDGQ